MGTHAIFVRLFITDENVVWLLVSADREDRIVKTVDLLSLTAIDALRCYVGIFHSKEVVFILHKAFEARPVAGGLLLACCRIVDVLDTPIAQAETPVSLGLLRKFGDELLVQCRRLVEFVVKTQAIRTIEESHFLFVVRARHGLSRPAVLAFNHLVGFGDIQVAAAHFAFENSHNIPPVYLFSLQSLFLSARIASAFLQSGTTLVSSLSTMARWSSSITALSSVSAATVASFETGSQ